MIVNTFITEQMLKLKENTYVLEVTEQFVYFAAEFKERFYNEYINGKRPSAIIVSMGIDITILRAPRINGIKRYVMEDAKRKQGFSDIHNNPNLHLPVGMTLEEKIKRLEHQLAYTRQELEFVKKIASANREAQAEWDLKQNRE